jgi:phospholipid/cholesterol/gamma-HCH transport system substrate-binding protein
MNARFNYVLVGLFVLVLGGVMITAILWLAAGGSGRAYDEYLVYMRESVSGLSRDSTVKYHGVGVGTVREISLDPNNPEQVRLLLRIDQGTPVREDTTATLEVQGLTGLAYINLDGGSQASPALRVVDNEDFAVIPSLPSIWGRLDHSVGELIDNLIMASNQINRLLNDENQDHLTDTLAHFNVLSGTLASRSDVVVAALDELNATIRNARSASEQLPELMSQMKNTASAMERMAKQIGSAGVVTRKTVAATGLDVRRFTGQTLPETTALINELRQTAENFRRLSEQLERNPSILLYGKPVAKPGPGE